MRVMLAVVASLIALAGPAASQTPAPPGASSCSGCHDARIANPAIPPLKGRPATDIVAEMQAFRDGKREGTIMGRLAKGFSDSEIQAIATWLSQR
jgi:cytochrome c553